MPSIETFKLDGAKELDQALKQLVDQAGKSTQGKAAVRRSGIKALGVFVRTWQSIAPVLSGHYRESIHAGTRLSRRQARIARKDTKSQVTVHAGTTDPAGIMTEFGNAHQAAEPSARPAWDQTKNRVLAEFGHLLGADIVKTAARLQRKLARRR